jgi:DNA-binding NtrC family response regulator
MFPMASGRLLIVAPDADLRLSLQFALEAEGYAVTARANIGETTTQERFDCTILDHRAAIGPTEDIAAFCRRAHPVVLLASEPSHGIGPVFRLIQKPLLGEPLSAAVRDALMVRRSPRPK